MITGSADKQLIETMDLLTVIHAVSLWNGMVLLLVGTIGRSFPPWSWSCLGLEAPDLGLGTQGLGLAKVVLFTLLG